MPLVSLRRHKWLALFLMVTVATGGATLAWLKKPDEALAAMGKAIDLATARHEKLWLLRAAASQLRLGRKLGVPASSDLLRSTLDSFAEGKNLPDLIEARELLTA